MKEGNKPKSEKRKLNHLSNKELHAMLLSMEKAGQEQGDRYVHAAKLLVAQAGALSALELTKVRDSLRAEGRDNTPYFFRIQDLLLDKVAQHFADKKVA